MNRIEERISNTLASPSLPASASASASDSIFSSAPAASSSSGLPSTERVDAKTIIIILLIIFLTLTLVGTTLMNILGNFTKTIIDKIMDILQHLLRSFGYNAGTALNATSDVTADVLKIGVDLTDGAINNIGNLLIGSNTPSEEPSPSPPPPPAEPSPPSDLEKTVQQNNSPPPQQEPSPDTSENSIQKPITSDKLNWCLVGEYQNRRGCIEITDADKCMSGQVFPNQKMCLNPTWTP